MKYLIKQIVKKIYYGTPYSWRVPNVYYDTLQTINNIQTDEDISSFQLNKFKELVGHAYQNVPGYYQLYKDAGIKPSDIQSLEDIKRLPIIDKELIRENISDFTARNVSRSKLFQSRTSGSTGQPFGFYKTWHEEWIEQAFVGRAWSQGGWSINQSGIMLRGAYAGDKDHIVKKCDNGSFYVHNHSFMMSPNFLTQGYYPVYRDFLVQHPELTYIFALPSSITLLAQLMIENHDEGISSVKAIYLGSESVYSWQYEFIKKAFPNTCVISLYGQTERVIMAYWCALSQKYHIDPLYGITEVLNDNEDVLEGQTGELIGTSFWNTTTPFIRYRTKDFAVRGASMCESCGLHYIILDSIEGRLQDVLIGKEGRYIPYTAFDGSLLHGKVFKDILKYKIIQKEKGKLLLEIVVNHNFDNNKKVGFEHTINDYLGDDFESEVIVVDDIAPGRNGKYSIVEQHLPIDITTRINI